MAAKVLDSFDLIAYFRDEVAGRSLSELPPLTFSFAVMN